MRTYYTTITLRVDARDYDEAVDIAQVLRKAVSRTAYKVRDVDVDMEDEDEL